MKISQLIFGVLLLAIQYSFGQIKIGDNPQNLHNASVLELESSTHAFVIPRMTTADMEKILPLQGAIIYNTDLSCVHYYDGTKWKNLCGASQSSFTSNNSIIITESPLNTYDFKVGLIGTEEIKDFTINSLDIQDGAITKNKIGRNQIGQEELSENAVGTTEIIDASINTIDIAPSNIANTVLITNETATAVEWINKSDLANAQADQITITGNGSTIEPLKIAESISNQITDNATEISNNNTLIANHIAADLDIDNENELQNLAQVIARDANANGSISNLTDPILAQDAATKNYVDNATGNINTLTNGNIYIGNDTNNAQEQFISGDATLSNIGELTIITSAINSNKIANESIATIDLGNAIITPEKIAVSGNANQILRINGAATAVEWVDTEEGTDDQTAVEVPFTATPNTTSTDVQNAIEELQTEIDGIAGGEVNTASNTGTDGTGIFVQKTGANLEFKNINAGSNKITVINDAVNNEIDIDIDETNLNINATQITGLTILDDQTAIEVPFTATPNTTSTDVQNAIEELQTEIDGIAAGGEVNTASNTGTDGTGIFVQKTGANLEFKNINAGSNKITVINDAANNEIDIDIDESNLNINATQITGLTILDDQTAVEVPFSATPNTTSTDVQNAIEELQTEIDGIAAGGEVNTASNTGTDGTGIFVQKTGVNLEFKNINAGSDKITVTNDAANNEIDIDIDETNLNIDAAQITGLTILDDQIAVEVPFTATPNTTSTDVQNAIEELQTEIDGIAAGGEVNTASNTGTDGTGIFVQKTGANLEFKNINAGSNKIAVINDAANNEIDIDIDETNLNIDASQITGLTVLDDQTAVEVPFTATPNTTSTDVQNAIEELQTEIDGIAAGGEVNTASNTGTDGTGIFVQKTGANLEFKNINAGSNKITVINDAANNEIDIDIDETNLNINATQITGLTVLDDQTAIEVPFTATPNTTSTDVQNAIEELQTEIDGIAAGGEVNTASNTGTDGTGIFVQKTAANLEFKNINAGSNKITVINDAVNNEIDIDIDETNLNINAAQITGLTVLDDQTAVEVPFTATPNTTSTDVQNAIEELQTEIDGIAGGEVNTASNTGTDGTGIFIQKTGANLEFKNINAGSNKITVINDASNNEIDIDIDETNLNIDAAQITGLTILDDQTAVEVPFTATANTTSTDVQNAIEELQTEIDGVVAGTNLATQDLTQSNETRTYDLNGNDLIFIGTGNVGIGSFPPGGPANKFHVAGEMRSEGYNSSEGTESNPAYSFSTGSDIDTGMFRISADNLGFSVGGILGLQISELSNITTTTVTGSIIVNQSVSMPIETTTTDLTLNETHYTVIINADINITLPLAGDNLGRIYILKNISANSQNISNYRDSVNIDSTQVPIGVTQLQSDGTNWQQIN